MSSHFDIAGLTERALLAKDGFMRGVRTHGKDNPVKSQQISEGLGISNREVRALVSYLRIMGEPIGSDTTRGYYYCRTVEELAETKAQIKNRAKALTEVLNGLERAESRIRCGGVSQATLL